MTPFSDRSHVRKQEKDAKATGKGLWGACASNPKTGGTAATGTAANEAMFRVKTAGLDAGACLKGFGKENDAFR